MMEIKVEDDYLRKISSDLQDGFIFREYQLEHPQLTADYTEKAIEKYRSDHYFHHRVDSLVAGVMQIVQKHI